MRISFLSFDENHQKTAFQSEGIKKDNTFEFEDKTCENTRIILTIKEEIVILERKGACEMKMSFQMDKPTKGYYKNKEGLEFEFDIHTRLLNIEETKIKLQYAMLMDEEITSIQTIQFSFFNA